MQRGGIIYSLPWRYPVLQSPEVTLEVGAPRCCQLTVNGCLCLPTMGLHPPCSFLQPQSSLQEQPGLVQHPLPSHLTRDWSCHISSAPDAPASAAGQEQKMHLGIQTSLMCTEEAGLLHHLGNHQCCICNSP